MYYHLEATDNFFQVIDYVDTLIYFAIKENNEGRIKNHDLFLNLSLVSLVQESGSLINT
ncbi:hypothetical protein THIOM_004009 [Candidatus Thiomargarita nelsonii]|uniref:Uncharacterized protein n=1 Tax=Candidatus Thiomargarita nelsonii TaxID=1003181 RepID=A0A176RX06_9GAMM|nr:hypothetical protein THIOM_004009 [Candidatus Thiomargarita nelsonii]